MKQVQSKLWVKITALLLLSICSVVLLFSALGIERPYCVKRIFQ